MSGTALLGGPPALRDSLACQRECRGSKLRPRSLPKRTRFGSGRWRDRSPREGAVARVATARPPVVVRCEYLRCWDEMLKTT